MSCSVCGREDWSVEICAMAQLIEASKPMGVCDDCHIARLEPTGLLDPPGMDRFNLERFVTAQDPIIDDVLAELERGRKQTHWMWFVFPQPAGLGYSATSQRYAIASMVETFAYLRHPVLGPRLTECCRALAQHLRTRPEQILGDIDAMKLHSSATLFSRATNSDHPVHAVLAGFFDNQPDPRTLEIIDAWDL